MAKASGTIDLRSQKAAHDDAAKTATSYITKVDDNGIKIHPSSDATGTSNYTLINGDGFDVYRSGVSQAFFGYQNNNPASRIGLANAYNTYTDAEGFKIRNKTTVLAGFTGSSIWLRNASNFSVDENGKLTAKSADISGKITATSGKIGGWDILSSRIERDLTGSGGLRSGMQNTDAYSAMSAVFYAGCNTAAGGTIANLSNTRFYVTQNGNVYGREMWIGDTSKICSEITDSGIHVHYGSSNSWAAGLYVENGSNSDITYGMLGMGKYNRIIVRGGSSSNSDTSGNLQITCGSKPFNITATNATLKVNEIHVGGNKPFAFRLVAKKNQSVSANSGAIFNFDANTPSGYTLLGAVSVYTNHQYACRLGAVHTSLENDQIRVGLSNTSASAITDLEISVRIMYAKSGIFAALS